MERIAYVDDVKGYLMGETEEDGIIVYYDDWATAQGYKRMEDLRAELYESDCSEDEFDRIIEETEEEFEDWCNEVDVVGQYV